MYMYSYIHVCILCMWWSQSQHGCMHISTFADLQLLLTCMHTYLADSVLLAIYVELLYDEIYNHMHKCAYNVIIATVYIVRPIILTDMYVHE